MNGVKAACLAVVGAMACNQQARPVWWICQCPILCGAPEEERDTWVVAVCESVCDRCIEGPAVLASDRAQGACEDAGRVEDVCGMPGCCGGHVAGKACGCEQLSGSCDHEGQVVQPPGAITGSAANLKLPERDRPATNLAQLGRSTQPVHRRSVHGS